LLALTLALLGAAGAGWFAGNRQRASAEGVGMAAPAAAASGVAGPPAAASRRFAGAARVQPVTVVPVRLRDVPVLLSAIGTVQALNTVTVRAKVDGELRALRFQEGQLVKAGQVLAQIDPRNYEIALAQAKGQLARDQAQWRNARLDLERYKDLLAKDAIARQQVDTQEALVAQLDGTVQTDQAQVDNAQLQLSYTQITAPISGRLGLRLVDPGNMVRASDATGLVSITQTQPVNTVFALPESQLPLLRRKLQAGQALTVQAWDREQKQVLATGRVSSLDNAIDTSTGSIKLKAVFANADQSLYPNQFVNMRLQVDTLAQALVVPASAIQRGAQGTFVYVVKDDNSVAVRRIQLGASEGDFTSVQGELKPGERVVSDGADRLRDGAKVEIITPSFRPSGRPGTPAGTASAPARSASALGPSAAPSPNAAQTHAAPAVTGTGASAPAAAAKPADGAAAASPAGERPAWMDRLPPEVRDKLMAMSPEERRAFIEKRRAQRQSEAASP